MSKHTRKYRSKKENPDLEDLPEYVIELLALIGSAATALINGAQQGAFSGRHGEFFGSSSFSMDKTIFNSRPRWFL